jgi:hypothetical protein
MEIMTVPYGAFAVVISENDLQDGLARLQIIHYAAVGTGPQPPQGVSRTRGTDPAVGGWEEFGG